jgi:hypothetical protein
MNYWEEIYSPHTGNNNNLTRKQSTTMRVAEVTGDLSKSGSHGGK